MDPAQLIADYVRTPPRHTIKRGGLLSDLRAWYTSGGFKPSIDDVAEILRREADAIPAGWATVARSLKAVG